VNIETCIKADISGISIRSKGSLDWPMILKRHKRLFLLDRAVSKD